MAQDLALNERLKRMWRIKEELEQGKVLSDDDRKFFKLHLFETFMYYENNAHTWAQLYGEWK